MEDWKAVSLVVNKGKTKKERKKENKREAWEISYGLKYKSLSKKYTVLTWPTEKEILIYRVSAIPTYKNVMIAYAFPSRISCLFFHWI